MQRLLTLMLFVPVLVWAGQGTIPTGHVVTMGGASNGEVGNKSGANDSGITPSTYPGNDQGETSCFVASVSGTVRYIHVYMDFSSGTSGQQYNAAIYDSTGTTLLRDGSLTDEGTVPGITTITLDSDLTIASGTTYCLTFGSHNSGDGWHVTSTNSAGASIFEDSTYTVGATMPSTVDISTVRNSNEAMRIWATNTANGS